MKVAIAAFKSAKDITLKSVFDENGILREIVLAVGGRKLLVLNLMHKSKRKKERIIIDELVFDFDRIVVDSKTSTLKL